MNQKENENSVVLQQIYITQPQSRNLGVYTLLVYTNKLNWWFPIKVYEFINVALECCKIKYP